MKAWFGLLQDVKVVDINRLLKSHGVRLVVKKSKDWGKNVSVTAHAVGAPAKRARATKVPAAPMVRMIMSAWPLSLWLVRNSIIGSEQWG